ncbi:hypothetical protein GH714_007717 [Hevea brasiliensis]|uniref:Transposase-associated domain-containing protein n=1 Tax=Hevea brasiliensis TaxID=3981 RepID=A0A6A6MDK3_HEVBR|nr:hypothetical protein GH714_007717 [Hevea brasiliensis]
MSGFECAAFQPVPLNPREDDNALIDRGLSEEYMQGVENFLEFAFTHSKLKRIIPCPYIKCNNFSHKTRDEVGNHLLMSAIVKGNTHWLYHGKFATEKTHIASEVENEDGDDILGMIHDAVEPSLMDTIVQDAYEHESTDISNPNFVESSFKPVKPYEFSKEASKFYKLLENAQKKLYPGCDKFSKLSLTVKLFQIKFLLD